MPFSAKVYRDPDLQHVRFWGEITVADLRGQFAAGPKAPGYYPGISTLADLRGLTGVDINLAGIMSLRDRLIERHIVPGGPPMRIALLADSDTAFGSARVFETICSQSSGLEVEIFRMLPDALAFLDLSEAEFGSAFSEVAACRNA